MEGSTNTRVENVREGLGQWLASERLEYCEREPEQMIETEMELQEALAIVVSTIVMFVFLVGTVRVGLM